MIVWLFWNYYFNVLKVHWAVKLNNARFHLILSYLILSSFEAVLMENIVCFAQQIDQTKISKNVNKYYWKIIYMTRAFYVVDIWQTAVSAKRLTSSYLMKRHFKIKRFLFVVNDILLDRVALIRNFIACCSYNFVYFDT